MEDNKTVLSDDPSGFVAVTDMVPDVILDIRYYSADNFIGERIDGYEEPIALLTREAALALKKAAGEISKRGLRFRIYDAYRPQMAVDHFVRWSEDADDIRMKEAFYPMLSKQELFPLGFIAAQSGHSRGSTVDLTLYDCESGRDLDMGGRFDFFGEISRSDYTELLPEQLSNRRYLREVMEKSGFLPLREEWWHYTLKDEPYPHTYFTFPNRHPEKKKYRERERTDMRYENRTFDEERALYGADGIEVIGCRFDGPADGESAMKEGRNIRVRDSFFNLRYPFWHDENLFVTGCEMTDKCRAALWYSSDISITDTRMHGIKALRECSNVNIRGCDIISPEFGWSVRNITMEDSSAQSEYFMMRSEKLTFKNVTLQGKYSFQYITDAVFEDCSFDTKDAFWHAKDTVIRNCIIKGEYLAWYCENVTFENCTIIGTQPLCYCKNLVLKNCHMTDTDLAFEKSEVDATIDTEVVSIKNPLRGRITVPAVGEIIMDDENAKGRVVIAENNTQKEVD